jgi:hypothetical protein
VTPERRTWLILALAVAAALIWLGYLAEAELKSIQ